MKTLLKLLLLLASIVYLAYSFIHSPKVENDVVCSKIEVTFGDSIKEGFINQTEIEKILQKENLHPINQPIDSVKGQKLVTTLLKNKYIKTANCYKSPKGVVKLEITQRRPILRVMPDEGNEYYIDEEGVQLPTNDYTAYVVVATGHITKEFSKEKLPALAKYIEEDEFWKSQISQIHVNKSGKIDLYNRVGEDMVVHYGNCDSIAKKFLHLKAFYEKVLPEAGWNTYSTINVNYDNQIIGTRRSKKEKER
jgi:cell division protein FtsQ